MAKLKPEFVVNVGDLHYSAMNSSTYDTFVYAYHEVFKSPKQRDLY